MTACGSAKLVRAVEMRIAPLPLKGIGGSARDIIEVTPPCQVRGLAPIAGRSTMSGIQPKEQACCYQAKRIATRSTT
jgi:hypothetical protein